MREKLGLVSRHIHLDRTIVFAPLARKTQVERLPYGFIPPTALYHVGADHLVHQASPAARGVLLFARHHVARAHDAVAAFEPAADAGPDTPIASRGEAVV